MSGLKILTLTNTYPPVSIGGYEIGCQEAVEYLRGQGHQVQVLTSDYKRGDAPDEPEVDRSLEPFFRWTLDPEQRQREEFRGAERENCNARKFHSWLEQFEPDLIYLWNPMGLGDAFMRIVLTSGIPVCHYNFGYWLGDFFQKENPFMVKRKGVWKVLPAWLQRKPTYQWHVQHCSKFCRDYAEDRGHPVDCSVVIPWGIEFPDYPKQRSREDNVIKILYAGQLVKHKGIHTAIQAVAELNRKAGVPVQMDIAGDGVVVDYKHEIETQAAGVEGRCTINFLGSIERAQLRKMYSEYDILVFPSEWDEPFGIVLLEGMATGLAIVATGTGGSGEIVENGETALIFEPGNVEACTKAIDRLINDQDLCGRLGGNARKLVQESYEKKMTMNALEKDLTGFLSP